MKGTKVYVGEELCGTIDDAPAGTWLDVNCKATGEFLKIVALPNQYLHFCGLKIWEYVGNETIAEEEEPVPEPIKPIKTSTGKTVVPEPEEPRCG